MANDWPAKIGVALIPAVLAISGWAYSLDVRLRDISSRQDERGPRIRELEDGLESLRRSISDPSPRPETRVILDGIRVEQDRIEQRMQRLEERLNGLHLFLITVTNPKQQRRGEIDPPPPFKQVN